MSRIPIGVQLYSVREACAQDLPGTLAAIAKMGYDGVEFAGYHGRTATELKALLDENGLKCCGTHTMLETLQGDALAETVAFNQAIGNRFLIVPWVPDEKLQGEAGLATAAQFNQVAETLSPLGMRTGYHNHHTEFTPVNGVTPWSTFFGNTRTDVVMQLDLGNGLAGEADLIQILEEYPGRPTTVHLKPYSRSLAASGGLEAGYKPLIGEDEVPWQSVFDLCEGQGGTEWYIVEYESDAHPPLTAVAKCLEALKAMGR